VLDKQRLGALTVVLSCFFAGCSGDGGDSGDKVQCGSTMAFIHGTVTGSGATSAEVFAYGGGDDVLADWTAVEGDALRYELNVEGGDWTVSAFVGDCESEPFELSIQACEEREVDLTVSCR